MYAQSQLSQGKPLSAYDIYIQENIARREALRVKPHPYTPKDEPIRVEVNEVYEPVKDTAVAEIPVQPKVKNKRTPKKPIADCDAWPENLAEPVKPRPVNNKNKIRTVDSEPLLMQPRAGPV